MFDVIPTEKLFQLRRGISYLFINCKYEYSISMVKKLTHNYYVYILTNKNKTVLYTGVTNDLKERIHFHQNPTALSKAFTTRYRCYYLIYYEHFISVESAIQREKQIKGYKRSKKEKLIDEFNPNWNFLNDKI